MEKIKVFREGKRIPLIIGAFAVMIMLTLGVGIAQYQTASVTNNLISEKPCIGCAASFDGEDDEICPFIMPIMQQIIVGYESGNPVGWSLLFPGYDSSGHSFVDQSQASQQTGRILFSIDDMDSVQKEVVDDKIGISRIDQSTTPYLTEEEIYVRALEMSDHCSFGDLLGDWFGSDSPGECYENRQAFRMSVLQCFKLGAPPILGGAVAVLSIILASVAISTYVFFQVVQILVGWAGLAYDVAVSIAQALQTLFTACINYWYPIYCEIL